MIIVYETLLVLPICSLFMCLYCSAVLRVALLGELRHAQHTVLLCKQCWMFSSVGFLEMDELGSCRRRPFKVEIHLKIVNGVAFWNRMLFIEVLYAAHIFEQENESIAVYITFLYNWYFVEIIGPMALLSCKKRLW